MTAENGKAMCLCEKENAWVFNFTKKIDLPKTEVFLQSGIYDLAANHAGTLEIPLHVVAAPALVK